MDQDLPEKIDTAKADSKGRINLGIEYADKKIRFAVVEVVEE